MRRWTPAALAALAACAQIQAPPGGPEDRQGPQLVTTRPDSLAKLSSFPGPVVLVFDEGLSEEGLEDAVDVSPRTSSVAVEKRGDELRVDLRRGWQRDRVYQVTVENTVQDRFHNRIAEPIRLVFSTGPDIPATVLTGHVLERQTGNVARAVRVEALSEDSLVYAVRTDSTGTFRFEHLPLGEYRVHAYNDPNKNREMEPFEAQDSARATIIAAGGAALSLSIVTPDSTAPRMSSATAEQGVISVKFDDYLDPAQPAGEVQVQLFGPDSAVLAVAEFKVGTLAPPADSAAGDSTRRDTARARADTARADSARPRGPVPAQTLAVRPAAPLAPDVVYRVTVSGVRNLVGLTGGGSAQFRTPKAPPPAPPAPAAAPPPAPEPVASPPPATPPATPPVNPQPPARPRR